MKVTIIGAGNIGSGLAFTFGKTAHDVTLAARKLESAQAVSDKLAAQDVQVHAATISNAVPQAEVILLAVPYDAVAEIISQNDFEGKLVIDVTNPVKADFSGLSLGFDTSAAEEIQALLPTAKVVKGFNTVFAQIYQQGLDFGGQQAQTFIAGDDAGAKETALALAKEAGFNAIDAGALSNARYLEPLAYMNIHFGYMLGKGTQIIPAWLSR